MASNYIKPLQILKASAGSGKTFSLTVQFLALLFSGTDKYRRIMAVTFTNKATAEMKQRILSVLEGFARGNWSYTNGYLKALQAIYPELDKAAVQEKAHHIYRQILHDYRRLTITTIDKFVQQIIRSFTFELGIDADYQVTLNLRQVVRDLTDALYESMDDNPNLLEWIIERAKERINDGQSWNYHTSLQSLGMEIFSENFQSFDEAVSQYGDETLFSKVKEQAAAIKSAFRQDFRTAFDAAQKIFLDQDPGDNFFKRDKTNPVRLLTKDSQYFFDKATEKQQAAFLSLPGNCENWFNKKSSTEQERFYHLLNPALDRLKSVYDGGIESYNLALAVEANLYYLRLMKEMSGLLKDYRVANRLLLISDATHLLKGITRDMEDNPSFIWEKTGNRYQHFLFDEFQDTSENQWLNFRPLVKNALASAKGDMVEQLIVGDVKQSIYRWRGGNWEILLHKAEEALGKAFISTASLQTNFRSDGNIINFNNYVFTFLARWLQEQLNLSVERSGGPALYKDFWQARQYDTIIQRAYDDVRQQLPDDAKVEKGIVDWMEIAVDSRQRGWEQDTELKINRQIADRLHRWLIMEKRYHAGQIGILVRTNKEARRLLSFLKADQQSRAAGYNIISGDALLLKDNTAIQLLIHTFRLLQNLSGRLLPDAIHCIWLLRRLSADLPPLGTNEWLRIGRLDLKNLTGYLPGKLCRQPEYFLQLPLPVLTEELIKTYGIDKNAEALPFLLCFRDHIARFTADGANGLAAFLEWWDAQYDLSLPASGDSHSVKIMTIHKSKGLAFDVVLIPYLHWKFAGSDKDIIWASMAGTPFDILQKAPLKNDKKFAGSLLKNQYFTEQLFSFMDGLNTLYVAMTRVRHHLCLCLPVFKNDSKESNFVAGEAIINALAAFELTEQRKLIFPEESFEQSTLEQGPREPDTPLTYYPLAEHLNQQWQKEGRSQLERLNNDQNIRIGIAAHELLSRCHELHKVAEEINKLYQEGWFSENELAVIRDTVMKVLSHKELSALLNRPGRFLNERDIIAPGGMVHRPDKVLLRAAETLIIDYKFTGKEREEHIEQMQFYIKLFREMGFPDVRGWLFYGFQGELLEID
ncbi:MAG TPA: UvrD-helicase domain-containing protein [Edaphocola sp.]|nr:UvrD-helicase domain-containing protein [Edaphocola sp.]